MIADQEKQKLLPQRTRRNTKESKQHTKGAADLLNRNPSVASVKSVVSQFQICDQERFRFPLCSFVSFVVKAFAVCRKSTAEFFTQLNLH
jgi:hypothetical protein